MTVEILRKNRNTGRPMEFIKRNCSSIDDHIELLQAVKKEYGNILIAIPNTKERYGKDTCVSIDQISTTMKSCGEEIEW